MSKISKLSMVFGLILGLITPALRPILDEGAIAAPRLDQVDEKTLLKMAIRASIREADARARMLEEEASLEQAEIRRAILESLKDANAGKASE
ncbi:hypothetical protein KAW80_01345 [Candidatus Babeliales bacterium]|nr:hypothetical protein [Candidatus Babeliales bacterium]